MSAGADELAASPSMHEQSERQSSLPTTHQGRVRKPVSCWPCRRRKLRCDRGLPACSNCVHRGDITVCSYVSSEAEPRRKPSHSVSSSEDLPEAAQRKLDRLERLVISLVNQQQPTKQVEGLDSSVSTGVEGNPFNERRDHSESRSSGHRVPRDVFIHSNDDIRPGRVPNVNEPRCSVDEAHWSLLLNEIHDVRAHLQAQDERYEEQAKTISSLLQSSSDDPGPTLLFGSTINVSRADILSQLPSRYSCDIMISRYFAHLYPPLHILHKPTFRSQYARFWTNPQNVSIVWVGLLFTMLRIAMLDYLREGDEPVEWQGKCQDLAITFRRRFTECMILADYLQPHEFLIEALSLHMYGEYVSSRDAKSSIWVLGGMVTRLAMRMGYHQTDQLATSLTPFKAEMRRRLWAFIRQSDIMISFQMGLPSMISRSITDQSLPRNIRDDENFHEDSTTLPPALLDTEPTEISFLISKTKLASEFARAVQETNRSPPVAWDTVLEIDRELRRIYDSVPGYYKVGQLSQQDSLILTSARFTLASIHYKSLCIIHSRFLELARQDDRYSYSRRVCISSAMSILRIQAIQDQEIPVDGRLRSLTNYQTSLAVHDYLLAAAVICTDLSNRSDAAPAGQNSSGMASRADQIKAIELSAMIFRKMQHQSKDAWRAAEVLGMLVRKLTMGGNESARSRHNTHQPLNAASSFVTSGLKERSITNFETSNSQSARPESSSTPSSSTIPYLNPGASGGLTSEISRWEQPSLKTTRHLGMRATPNSPDSVFAKLSSHNLDHEVAFLQSEVSAFDSTPNHLPFTVNSLHQLDDMSSLYNTDRALPAGTTQGSTLWPSSVEDAYMTYPSVTMSNPYATLWDLNMDSWNPV